MWCSRRQTSASRIEISDADLKKAYTDRRARYETPERRHLKQIVFPNMEEAKAAADKLAQGTTFEALAAERGLKDSDIDLGTVAKSAVVDRDVADAAFALKSGEVSAPVQGRFGIAIVKVDAIEAGKTRPFEEVAAELKRDMQNERAKNELTNVQEKIEDERLGGATLADAARKFNLKPRVIEAIDRNGKDAQGNTVPDLPQNVDVLAAAFGADVHGENEPLRVPSNGGYVWFDVDAITPARDRPLDEVKDQVVARWRDDEIDDAAQDQGHRDAGQDQGRHVVRGCGRGRQAQGRMAAGHQARRPAGRLVRRSRHRDFQDAAGCGRQRRGREPRPNGSCFA